MDEVIYEDDIPGLREAVRSDPIEAVKILTESGGSVSNAIKFVAVVRGELEDDSYEKWAAEIYANMPDLY